MNSFTPCNAHLLYPIPSRNTSTSALEQAQVCLYLFPIVASLILIGALIILAMFRMNWNVTYCTDLFDRLARQLFPRRNRSICAQIRDFLACYLRDSRYDATPLELNLKDVFGHDPLFGVVKDCPSGTKIGVTTTTISDATLCLFTNYNGVGCRHKDAGTFTDRRTAVANPNGRLQTLKIRESN